MNLDCSLVGVAEMLACRRLAMFLSNLRKQSSHVRIIAAMKKQGMCRGLGERGNVGPAKAGTPNKPAEAGTPNGAAHTSRCLGDLCS